MIGCGEVVKPTNLPEESSSAFCRNRAHYFPNRERKNGGAVVDSIVVVATWFSE